MHISLEAEEVVLGRLVQHHSQASQQRQPEEPFYRPPPSTTHVSCSATSGGSHDLLSTVPPSQPAQATDALPEIDLDVLRRPAERCDDIYNKFL